MALKTHCLFCLERTVRYYSVLPQPNSASISGEDFGVGIIGDVREEVPADFPSLCTYLKISLPRRETGYGALVLSSSCDKFLCISCFEMVERLRKLYNELTGIRRRIREVILAHDISTNLSSTSRMRREEFGKEMGSNGSQENDSLAFVEMFQTLVKDVNLDFDDSADADDKAADKSNVETDELEMKIKLDEDDRNNFGGEGDPLFTESHNDMIGSGSPIENKSDEQPFDASEIESEISSEYEDDAEQKPEIMTDLTGKKKNKKRQWQTSTSAETKSVSSRTRKSPRLRRTFPEPSSSPSHTNETEPLQQFKCTDCHLSFTTMAERSKHRRKSHPLKLSTLKSLIASIPMVPKVQVNIPGGRNYEHNRKRTYICTMCDQRVTEESPTKLLNYMEHMLSHDHDPQSNLDEVGPYSCTRCDKQFDLKINLDLHVACIHDARQHAIRCNLCRDKVNYDTREDLVEHLKSTHDGDTIHTCKHCPMAHVSFDKLLLHMIKHKGCKRLICPECAAVYTTLKELHEHCHQVHPELKETYKCERCDKVFPEKRPLRNHMVVAHDFDRKSNTFKESPSVNLACSQCKFKDRNKIYKTQTALRIHIVRVHERKEIHKCDQCEDKCFGSKPALRKHVETFHEKIRYPCPHCTNSYTLRSYLTDHLKTHTGEGLLICEVCSKECPGKKSLKEHMIRHATFATEEKLVCEGCGKEFPGRRSLMRHKKNAHPKEKKVCPVCGIEYNKSYNLKTHILRKHSGYRPYQCPVCNQSFTSSDILKAHVNGVHGMEVEEAEEKHKKSSASVDL